ncbi:MAG TPA: PAS domain-containing protein, partial [Burkholderiaceae bacterium]|nr:PAS domain-containing protein [Burkholderiaceae bacterium]
MQAGNKGKTIDMMHAEWLPIVMQGSFSEIYVIDCGTLRFVQVNQAACENLQFDESDLLGKTPVDIARNLTVETLGLVLQPLRDGHATQATLETTQMRRDGSIYPIEYHFFYCLSPTEPVFIAIGNDVSARYEAAKALR